MNIKVNKIPLCATLILSAFFAISGCATKAKTENAPPPNMLGAERDQHGCIGSAGYAWCAKENACVRPWELAAKKGIKSDQNEFKHYCLNKVN